MSKPRTFHQLMSTQTMEGLDSVIRRGRQLQRLAALVRDKLGPELAAHCQMSNLRGTTLILSVGSTAWASRLRYQVPQLLQRFRTDERLSVISEIEIRVSPASSPPAAPPPRRVSMSDDAALCVQRCAESVDDQRLKSALSRLATRNKGRS